MPSTLNKNLPYPAVTDVPNVPQWLQQLAEATDMWLSVKPQHAYKSASQTVTNSIAVVDDTALQVTLTPGTWLVNAYLNATGPAAADIRVGAAFTGTTSTGGKHSLGPSLTTTNVQDGPMRSAVNNYTAPVGYGTDGTANGASIQETHRLVVTATGVFKIQFAQWTANAVGTVMNSGSWLTATQIA